MQMSDNFIINTKVIIGAVASIGLIILSLTFKNWTDNEADFKKSMVEEIKELNNNLNGVTERTLRNEITLEFVVDRMEKAEAVQNKMKESLIKEGNYP